MNAVRTASADGIGAITLDRSEQMNAINVELGVELERGIRMLGADPSVRVILIRGSGKNFCAGGDFGEVERLREQGPVALRSLFTAFRGACNALAEVAVPVVAAVEGVAAAGGFELMQAADVVLVSDDARIADNHVRFGMIPGGGSTQRLPRLIGRQQAMGVLLSGDRLTGSEAVTLGLAYRSFPQDRFDDEVTAFVTTMASRDRGALTSIKRLVESGLNVPLAAGLDDEISAVVVHICDGAGRNGASAFTQRGGSR